MLTGFGNSFESEAVAGALPRGRNNPQRPPHGLYAEQLSGTAFTAPKGENRRTWLYRIRPAVRHIARFTMLDLPYWKTAPHRPETGMPMGPLRWNPIVAQEDTDLLSAMRTMTTAGDAAMLSGMAAHTFVAARDMGSRYFCNADAEMAFLPSSGVLRFRTELGRFDLAGGALAVIPRGMVFAVDLPEGPASGYALENYGAAFRLPERGPIGANGLANERDFRTPEAAFEDDETPSTLVMKWGGAFQSAEIPASPLDVVAWHGNYVPYAYDLRAFNTMGSISYDHPDPSIFTVLTAPSDVPGTANVDLVVFPERWLVAEDTFRPPWYHRNVMSEFMGNLQGAYDAKPNGFSPGAMSLHNSMIPHGPDAQAFEAASSADLAPQKLENTLAFMIETRLPQIPTRFATKEHPPQDDYIDCWQGLDRQFAP